MNELVAFFKEAHSLGFVPLFQGGRRACCGRGSQIFSKLLNLAVNRLQHLPEIRPDLDISKSEKVNPSRFDELLPGLVFLLFTWLKMTVAVNFEILDARLHATLYQVGSM